MSTWVSKPEWIPLACCVCGFPKFASCVMSADLLAATLKLSFSEKFSFSSNRVFHNSPLVRQILKKSSQVNSYGQVPVVT